VGLIVGHIDILVYESKLSAKRNNVCKCYLHTLYYIVYMYM
jgi:hypothetical protein